MVDNKYGTDGICAGCGTTIAEERLDVSPYTPLVKDVRARSRTEKVTLRPIIQQLKGWRLAARRCRTHILSANSEVVIEIGLMPPNLISNQTRGGTHRDVLEKNSGPHQILP
jgi:hypothetical protein